MLYALFMPMSRCPVLFFDAPRPTAGFPSPAHDFIEGQLDLNEHLIDRPASTFIVRISGDSLRSAGIHSGDLAVVDRSIDPRSGHIVVAALFGELVVKRLRRVRGKVWLDPDSDDPRYTSIEIGDDSDFQIWGVIKNTIRNHLG